MGTDCGAQSRSCRFNFRAFFSFPFLRSLRISRQVISSAFRRLLASSAIYPKQCQETPPFSPQTIPREELRGMIPALF
jgi:hypothetical protein